MKRKIALGLGICFVMACSSGTKNKPLSDDKEISQNTSTTAASSESKLSGSGSTRSTSLTREAALQRSKQVAKVSYLLWFGLGSNQNNFEGRTVIRFDIKPKAKDISKQVFLDFEQGTLNSITLNGKQLSDFNQPERFDGHHIYFRLDELQSTGNQIHISYSHPYSTNGNGLHRFKDPVDGQVYLYTDFEPYYAHRVFPCFDQPDLKATYEVTAEVPKDWQVISNTLEKEVSSVDGRKSWIFPPSAPFSTYIFALHAGPFSSWKSNANGIPIRLFARKSLSKYVDHDEWLKITQDGLDYFNVQFGIPYPFTKYDQIIVPDFNAGAMENVGAVTFSEKYVYRTRVTQDRRRRRADTILHEMAHMWFGDLVTMKWWNGLWLNESFATFMAARAVDQSTHFSGSWQAFFSDIKKWAYWEDQLITSHPIELPVSDTDQAESIFDGITYGKGASSLKQLSFYIGEDEFRDGVQRYFQKYAFKNTTLSDFIKMLAEASSQDLVTWQKTWLQTAGVNTIKAQWACETDPDTEKSKISKFELIQTPANISNELRPHKTLLGLYYFPKNKRGSNHSLSAEKPIEVTYSLASTPVQAAIGKPCPDFVFPNYSDQDYVKVELDEISLNQAYKSLGRISDPLTRQMLWHTLWQMVIDGKIRAQDYAETAISQSKGETDTIVLSSMLEHLVEPSPDENSVLKFISPDRRSLYQSQLETWIKTRLLASPGASDQQIIWYHELLDVAQSPQIIQFLKNLLNGKQKLRGFTVDQERRWEIIETLARNNDRNIQEIIDKDLKKDSTDMGEKSAISAEAAVPDPVLKKKWLMQITKKEGNLPIAKLREAMKSYHLLGQEKFTKDSVDIYFETIPKLAFSQNIEDIEYSKSFANTMFPSLCEPVILEKTTKFLETYPNLPAPILKSLKIHRQEEERCIRAREKSLQPNGV